MNRVSLPCLAFCALVAGARPNIVTWPVPEGVPHNDDFTVRVRAPGGAWRDAFVYAVQVDMRNVRTASMVTFDFSGAAEVSVKNNRGRIETARIRPLSAGIIPTVKGDTLTFTLAQPCNLSVEVNGDVYHNLHVFTNALETDVPDPRDPNVIYVGPGVHTFSGTLDVGVDRVVNGQFGTQSVAASVIDVPSGKTLYLAGGAIVKAAIRCRGVENVRIRGRGILLEGREGVQVEHSKNVTIDDLIVVDSQHYTVFGGDVHGLTIRNLRAFSCRGNGDGIDLMCCTDVLIDGVFLRNSDDTVALYNHRWDFYGDTRNVTVRNSTLWADVAHPIHMGTHGNPAKPETLEHLVFSNIDILEHNEPQLDYQGCMSINVSDENLARDIRFEDIRVDDFTEGQLVNLRVAFNKKYCTAPGRGIEDVTFKNISYTGTHANMSIIEGYDDTRMIKRITFENLTINGREISWRMDKPAWYPAWDMGKIYVGPHVDGIEFLPAGGARPPAVGR
ncbi:MAG TPA: glycosyl hydrolase family 28 protein [Opitutaceae bacterium]|nr:glycosyl hydrolase family 28 protein [Opitutaceae bacterium]